MAGNLPPLEAQVILSTQGAVSELNKFLTLLKQSSAEMEKLGAGAAEAGLSRVSGGFREVANAGAAAIKVTDQIGAAMTREVAATDESIIGLRNQANALEIAAANGLSYAEAQQLIRTSALEAAAATDKQAAQIGVLRGQIIGVTESLRAKDAAQRESAAASAAAAAANQKESASTATLIAGLEREMAVLQEAKAAGLSYTQAMNLVRQANVQASIASPADVARVKELQGGINALANSLKETSQAGESVLGFFGRIAVFTVVAGVIVRSFFALTQAIKDAVSEGISFNTTLEEGRLGLAGILSTTRQVVDAQGKVVETARAYPFLLEQAAKIQHDVLLANIETLGTGEELLTVYNQVLASTRGQKGELSDVLKGSQIILDIEKLRGRAGELIVTEARQFFTAERAIGQEVAQQLQLRFDQQRALKASGDLLQELIKRGQIYLTLGQQLSQTWSGLTSTIQTFFSFIAGEAFINTFTGVKQIMAGMIDTLKEADAKGGLAAALNVSPEELRELGRALGQLTIDFVQVLAGWTNGFISLASEANHAWNAIKTGGQDAIDWLKSHTPEFVTTLGQIFNQITGRNFEAGPPTSASFAQLKKLENQAFLATGSFNALSGAVQKAADATTISWQKASAAMESFFHIVNPLAPPTAEQLAKIAIANLQVAEAAKRAADAQARLAEEIAQATGDVKGFLDARMAAIDRETAVEITRATKQGTLDRELTFIQTGDQVKRQEAFIKSREIILKVEQDITNIIKSQLSLQAEAAKGQTSAQGTLISSHLADLQLQLKLAQEHNGTIGEQIQLTKELGDAQIEQAKNALAAAQEALVTIQNNIEELKAQINLHEHNIALYIAEGDEINRSKESAKLRESTDELQRQQNLLPGLQANITAAMAGISRAGIEANNNLKQITTITIHWGDVIRDSLKQVFDALVAGTLKLKDAFRSLGIAIVGHITDAFAEVISKKLGFDSIIKQNVGGIGGLFQNLGGTITSIFGGVFSILGGNFGQFFSGLQVAGSGILDLFQRIAGATTNIGGGLIQAISGLGKGLGGLLGVLAGSGLAGLLGLTSSQAKTGGLFGGLLGGLGGGVSGGALLGASLGAAAGPIGATIGALLGTVLGSVFGDLFAHIPTKGTQIRKGVVKWLQGLDVEFADEINSKRYGFYWTKQYMKQAGLSFLDASEQFIPKNFPEVVAQGLDKQLLAAGILSTADLSKRLGKSLNQTGVTFANMIVDNLLGDPAKINTFLESWVDKTGATFGAFIDKAAEAFNAGRLDITLFKDAIVGAGVLFADQLPKWLNVATIALKHFTTEGKFDLGGFKKEIADIIEVFALMGQSAVDALTQGIEQGLSGADIAKNFTTLVTKNIRDAVVQGFIQGFLTSVIASAALAEPLAKIKKLITDVISGAITLEEFAKGLKEAMAAARPEIERIAAAIGIAGDELHTLLADAGLLPDEFGKATDSVSGLVSKIDELTQKLEDIAHKRIDISIRLLEDLTHLGIIQPTAATGARVGAVGSEFNSLIAKAGFSPIGTRPFPGLNDKDLQRAIDLADQYREAILADYDAQKSALEAALSAQLNAIHAEYAAKRQAIQDSINLLNEEKTAQQAVFQKRLDALNKELAIAQKFKQLADSLQSDINKIVTGNLSTLTGGQQLGFLQRQAAFLRSQIAVAAPDQKADLMGQLSGILQQMLGLDIFQKPSPEYQALFNDVVSELERMKTAANQQGNKVENIQKQIADTEAAMKSVMDSIDAQIKSLQAQEKLLSGQEQAAVDAATAANQAAIEQLGMVTAAKLQELHDQEDAMLAEQAARAEAQRQEAIDKLATLVKPEDIDALLANPLASSALILANLQAILIDIDHVLGGVISAQRGYYSGPLQQNQMFLAHRGEMVSIGNNAPGGSVNFAPSITVNVSGAVAGTGEQIGRGVESVIMDAWRNRALGREIRSYVDRKQ